MDYQYYEQNNPYQQPIKDKRSQTMASAALILGVTSIVTCTFLYISIASGAIAIILALLSKGGELTMSKQAKIACVLGAVGIGLTAIIYTVTFAAIIATYGSLEEYLRIYLQDYGMTLEEFL